MKSKKFISLFLSMVILFSSFTIVKAEATVTMYSQTGSTIVVNQSEVAAYQAVGWFLSIDDVTTTLYSSNGNQIVVYNASVDEYIALGWSKMPPITTQITECPVTFHDATFTNVSASITFKKFNIADFEYIPSTDKIRIHYSLTYSRRNYPSITLHCYNSSNIPVGDVPFRYDVAYTDVPSSTAFFTITATNPTSDSDTYVYCNIVNLYSLDGRSITIYDVQLPIYENVDWYPPVTMYAFDGRKITVPTYEVETYKSLGWYTYHGYMYYQIETLYNRYMAKNDYSAAVNLILKYQPYFDNTEYAPLVAVMRANVLRFAEEGFFINLPLGPLELGMKRSEVEELIGAPTSVSTEWFSEATADMAQMCYYPSRGITICYIRDKNNIQVIDNMEISYPCNYKTPQGIGIGSSEQDVLNAYSDFVPVWAITIGNDYGGVYFSYTNNIVNKIFVGAAAE